MKGYAGKIVRVDLTTRQITVEEPAETFYRRYLGGAGIASYYMLKEIPAGIDPLSAENKLIFAMGPLTGLALSGATRGCLGFKAPLTGAYGKCEVGGIWPMDFKRAGYDGLIVSGKADRPVYIWIDPLGKVEIREASHLWGKTVQETQQAIQDEVGEPRARVAAIGPAGENLVKYACIICDLKDAFGRGGPGAVMGAKNLKAIAVRGKAMPEVANPDKIKDMAKWFAQNLRDIPIFNKGFSDLGTGAAMEMFNEIGNLPSYNFDGGFFADTDKISPLAISNTIRIGMEGCAACNVKCKRVVAFDEPYKVTPELGCPEYETLGTLGACCGIGDLKAICWANQLCNLYALDTISAGMTIAFAMECFEKGILTLQDTGGLDLSWGNAEAMIRLIEMIVHRQGIGDLLAEGTRIAAQRLGRGAEKYAMHVKGQEMPMHDPRLKAGMGIIYSIAAQGADHNVGPHDTAFTMENANFDNLRAMGGLDPIPTDELSPVKAANTKAAHCWYLFFDSALICIFVPWSLNNAVELIRAATGWEYSAHEAIKQGERVAALGRLFNLREGITAEQDRMPERMFTGTREGALKGKGLDPAKMAETIKLFYAMMGWDPETGVPTYERLAELGIDWATSYLPQYYK